MLDGMSIDVSYQGLSIAKGAGLHLDPPGVYVEMDGPMPVGTRLSLSHDNNQLEGRVARINEGVGPGMMIVPADGGELPRWIKQIQPRAVQTVEIEAESELDLPSSPPAATAVATSVVSAPAPVQAARAAPAVPQEVEEAAPASASEQSASPPYEATQEMAIPSLDDEPKSDADGDGLRDSAEKRPSSKKKKATTRKR
jgi:hypothetical protein